ncbi:hypothetical protein BS47DRAFT_1356681 [Hydnum rufescens UP504]|uniref:Uncharacterized protein n=1 Tax=Hydnum rufescens UP504 TaxID=1448309 RepID=A0A9P6ABV7_9AGAM|nr:hypothetical protein BS47DRAFT_1356681 [Hydnum rufescens UP504]
MYTETSCCGADRCMFGSIFVVWASRRSRSHHLKSSNAILTEQHNNGGTRLCFSFSLSREADQPSTQKTTKERMSYTGTSRLRVLMLAVGVFATYLGMSK